MLRERHLACERGAAATTRTVIVDESIGRERRLPQQRSTPVGKDAGVNQQHRLAVSVHLVLDLDAVQPRDLHNSSNHHDD